MLLAKKYTFNIFLLSIEEANKYDITIPEYVLLDTVWWLRSPGDEKTGAAGVYGCGIINTEGYYVNEYGGVRPALWLSLDSQWNIVVLEDGVKTESSVTFNIEKYVLAP